MGRGQRAGNAMAMQTPARSREVGRWQRFERTIARVAIAQANGDEGDSSVRENVRGASEHEPSRSI
jgi:hypothetical protein